MTNLSVIVQTVYLFCTVIRKICWYTVER